MAVKNRNLGLFKQMRNPCGQLLGDSPGAGNNFFKIKAYAIGLKPIGRQVV